jgi:peptide/nickel transport system ATP-binding protein
VTSEVLSRPLLVARGVTKTYTHGLWPRQRRHKALDRVNLVVRYGRTVALVGSSGSGKTTLAMCLAGLERPDAGEIWLEDFDLATASKRELTKARRQVQIIFQDSAGALSPMLTAAEIVEEPLRLAGSMTKRQRQEKAIQTMAQVGLSPDLQNRRTKELSGGQRQRLAIARATVLHPQLLILDEPFTGLDLSTRGQIINLLLDLQETHALSYLYVSHELEVVRHFADEIAVMDGGQIVDRGPAADVLANPVNSVTRALLESSDAIRQAVTNQEGKAACATS